MARLFNVEVFSQTIGQGRSYYTGEEFNALLGSADSLFVQVFLDAAVDAIATATVGFETTNVLQEQTWVATGDTVTVNPGSFAAMPLQGSLTLPGTMTSMCAFSRFKVTTNKTGTTVRVVVCGRSR